jgi:hypothetical protein
MAGDIIPESWATSPGIGNNARGNIDGAIKDVYRALDAYMAALGDYASTPLGQAAMARASGELMPPV